MSIQYTADQLQRKFQGAPGAGGFARIAEVLREEGRHEEAMALCQEGLRARPGHLTGLLVLGKIYLEMDKPEAAREQFEAALRQDPRCLSALHHLARLMAAQQWQDAAAAYYRSILEIEPWDTETLARLRDLAPSGASAAGMVGMAGAAAMPEVRQETGGMPASEPVVEQFDLDQAVVDFVPAESNPGDLAGALEEISLEDALSAPPAPAIAAAPLPPTSAELAEPKPLDILPSVPAPVDDGEIAEPAPISGDDIGERLDSLFGVQDDKPVLKASPLPPEPPPGDATMQLPAFPAEQAGEAPVPAPTDLLRDEDPGLPDLKVSGEPGDLAPEDRVSGEDIENRLDALFSLTEGTGTQPVLHPAGEAVAAEAPVADATAEAPAFAPEAADAAAGAGEPRSGESSEPEAPVAPIEGGQPFLGSEATDLLTAAAASDAAERPAFLGDAPALGPYSPGLAAGAPKEDAAADLRPFPEDVILSAGPDAASTALAPDEVVTGQDVADKLDALFGDAGPRTEVAPRAGSVPTPVSPAETGIFPPPDGLPPGTASWAAARPAEDYPGAADTQAGPASGLDLPLEGAVSAPAETTIASSEDYSPARWDESPGTAAESPSNLLTTENMLPRGIGRESAPPVTGEDIEDRLDSLFNLDEPVAAASGSAASPAAGLFTAPPETDYAAALPSESGPSGPAPDAADGSMASGPESAVADAAAAGAGDVPAAAGDAEAPEAPERTMILPSMRESASDWLARQADDTLILGTGDVQDAGGVLAADPDPHRASAASGADTVGLEMVDGSDIESRLEQIFSPEEAAAQAAKAAAEAAIARGEATPEGAPILPEIEEPALETGEMPLPVDEEGILAHEPPAPSAGEGLVASPIAGTMISGEDIKNRLSEIFEDGPRSADAEQAGAADFAGSLPAGPEATEPAWEAMPEPDGLEVMAADPGFAPEAVREAAPEAVLPPVMDAGLAVDSLPQPEGAADAPGTAGTSAMPPVPGTGSDSRGAAASLAPLQDEEEGAPEEEENAPQSAAGANVATVTLAEIYFQQGLREQALQIYRQLLEREPGNESVRKRIQDIEASKPEAGPGPGADPRRPRPGLKVPKRKK